MAVGEEQPTLAIVMQMLEQQQKQFKQLETRLESKAAPSSARHDDSESDGYGSDASARSERSYGSSNSSATNLSDYEFVPVRDSNPHWGSRALAASCDDEPKRHELYGNKTFDQLCGGRHEGGGALGWSFEYAEAISLHQYSANDDLRELLEQLPRDDPLRDRLGSLLRTNEAIYNLANEFRELIRVQARAVRAGMFSAWPGAAADRPLLSKRLAFPIAPGRRTFTCGGCESSRTWTIFSRSRGRGARRSRAATECNGWSSSSG